MVTYIRYQLPLIKEHTADTRHPILEIGSACTWTQPIEVAVIVCVRLEKEQVLNNNTIWIDSKLLFLLL